MGKRDSERRRKLLKVVRWRDKVLKQYNKIEKEEEKDRKYKEYKSDRRFIIEQLRRQYSEFEITDNGKVKMTFNTFRLMFIIIVVLSCFFFLNTEAATNLPYYYLVNWLLMVLIPTILTISTTFFLSKNNTYRRHFKKIGFALACIVTPIVIYLLLPKGEFSYAAYKYDKETTFFAGWFMIGIWQYLGIKIYIEKFNEVLQVYIPPVDPKENGSHVW